MMSNMSALKTISIKLLRSQRDYFERASDIGGYRSLSDFMIAAAAEKGEAIIQKHNAWLSSAAPIKRYKYGKSRNNPEHSGRA
jgi:uncharacterized protein (DUF1778 family)